ncbi:hypothetical protein ACTWQB_16795 [Piscibacillus sp. B03]|uniref:hypothetical protein n=1 Tax=Piscibacillus sp. B03 TaxID=3457430 RepID=UPI003FCD0C9F
MEQLSFYDYLDKEEDPLYQKLLHVTKEMSVTIGPYNVSRNQANMYEAVSEDDEFPASSIDDCYEKLNKRMNKE